MASPMKKSSWVLEVAAGLGMASAYFCCLPHCHGVSFPESALFQVTAFKYFQDLELNITPNNSRFVRGMSQRDIAGLWAHTTAFISGFACAIRCRGVVADVFWSLLIIGFYWYVLIDDDWCWHSFHRIDWLGTWCLPMCERTTSTFAAQRLA